MVSTALLGDGTVLIAGGQDPNLNTLASAELYTVDGTGGGGSPHSLQITPVGVTMLIGGIQQFTVVDNLGHPRMDATWSLDNPSLATISGGSSPILTGVASGQLTLTATVGTQSAQTQISISPLASLAPGTSEWSIPSSSGFSFLQLAHAIPTSTGPALYSIQLNNVGTQTQIQGLTADGQQRWKTTLPAVFPGSVPDANGGLLVTEYPGCDKINPITIAALDPASGAPTWQLASSALSACMPIPPQMAIRGDGSIVVTSNGNIAAFPELMLLDGKTGHSLATPTIPTSSYTDISNTTISGFSPIGAPIVDSTGTAYLEYEVRNINAYMRGSYPATVSCVLWLLKIAPDGTSSSTQLSSSTNMNLFPGNILPDGNGGILATWTIVWTGDTTITPPTQPYQAAYISQSGSMVTYPMPGAPSNLTNYNPSGFPDNPVLLLGSNGKAFGSYLTSIVSFDLTTGALDWKYQVAPTDGVSLAATLDNGGVAIVDFQQGVLYLDQAGTATPVTGAGSLGGSLGYSWSGAWFVQGTQAAFRINIPFGPDPGGVWATPGGNPSQSLSAEALCDCLIQTSAAPASPSMALSPDDSNNIRGFGEIKNVGLASVANCPICTLPPPTQSPVEAPSCATVPGSGPTYLLLVGDPGRGSHNNGQNFNIAAQTNANDLNLQGNKIVACRVSSVENVVTALTTNGLIDGGVIYFGHGGPFNVFDSSNRPLGRISILAPGQGTGVSTNISILNVSQLAATRTAGSGSTNIIAATASILINGCSAGLEIYDYFANFKMSIAQQISNQTKRRVYAYTPGMYFSLKDSAHATSSNYLGEPNPLPASLPLYLVPNGTPGKKPNPQSFTPQ